MSRGRVLVVGARDHSLGAAVATYAHTGGYDVYKAGISGEAVQLDLSDTVTGWPRLTNVLANLQPQHIVCTVGFNMPQPHESGKEELNDWWRWHYETNAMMPLRLLDAWLSAMDRKDYERHMSPRHYVAISSNSARLPRSQSAAYCASKAALSMALRVRAREEKAQRCTIYGYEPGLLDGTPMTAKSRQAFAGSLTRMRPDTLVEGARVADLAQLIVGNLAHEGQALNGVLLPYDADEL